MATIKKEIQRERLKLKYKLLFFGIFSCLLKDLLQVACPRSIPRAN